APRLRRAHRRSRSRHRRRDPHPPADAEPRARQDHRDGDPRSQGSRVRQSPAPPGQGHAGPQRGRLGPVRYLPLLWAGLFRRKTRTIRPLRSSPAAFCLSGLRQAVRAAFEPGADTADAKRLLTTARYSIIEPLPMAYARRIEQVPGVVAVAYADWFGAKY